MRSSRNQRGLGPPREARYAPSFASPKPRFVVGPAREATLPLEALCWRVSHESRQDEQMFRQVAVTQPGRHSFRRDRVPKVGLVEEIGTTVDDGKRESSERTKGECCHRLDRCQPLPMSLQARRGYARCTSPRSVYGPTSLVNLAKGHNAS